MGYEYINQYVEQVLKVKRTVQSVDDLIHFEDRDGDPMNLFKAICCDNTFKGKGFDHIRLVKDCIDLGIDVNHYYINLGGIPVVHSALSTRPDIALYLLENGAYNDKLKNFCKEKKNLVSVTVSHFVEEQYIESKIKILDFLKQQKYFDPTIFTDKGINLLQATLHPDILKWLLDNGCDPLQKNRQQGINAITYHQNRNNQLFVTMLKNYVAHNESDEILKEVTQNKTLKEEPQIMINDVPVQQSSNHKKMVL